MKTETRTSAHAGAGAAAVEADVIAGSGCTGSMPHAAFSSDVRTTGWRRLAGSGEEGGDLAPPGRSSLGCRRMPMAAADLERYVAKRAGAKPMASTPQMAEAAA